MKTTSVKKNPKIRNTIHQQPVSYTYNPLDIDYRQDMDYDSMAKLSRTINRLTKEEHIEIYKFLRKYVDATFFAPNNTGTYFNLNNLDNMVKWELHRIVQ